jgi:hypothetical protein
VAASSPLSAPNFQSEARSAFGSWELAVGN